MGPNESLTPPPNSLFDPHGSPPPHPQTPPFTCDLLNLRNSDTSSLPEIKDAPMIIRNGKADSVCVSGRGSAVFVCFVVAALAIAFAGGVLFIVTAVVVAGILLLLNGDFVLSRFCKILGA